LIDPAEKVFHGQSVLDAPFRDQRALAEFAGDDHGCHELLQWTLIERRKHSGVSSDQAEAVIRIEQIRHQKRAFDLVSVTIRTTSSRSSPHHPGADRRNEAAVDRRPSAWLDRESLAIRVLVRAREDFVRGFSFPRFFSTRALLLVFNNAFLLTLRVHGQFTA
jgi:hypothetical protein